MQQPLAHKIRHADTLAKHYFSTLSRLEEPGKRRARKSTHPADMVQSTVAEASAVLPKLLSATEEAKAGAEEEGLPLGALVATNFESPVNEEDYPELKLQEALQARSEIGALRKHFPMTDWSSVLDEEPNIDLYASARKKLWIAGGILASATLVLAIVAPDVAIGLGCVTAFLAVKVYKSGLRSNYWG
jgi:hypothetical protein